MGMKRASRAACVLALVVAAAALRGQEQPAGEAARRVDTRMRALQQEADRLARESRTLIGDLRQLEIERDLRRAEAVAADAAATAAAAALGETNGRIRELERRRVSQLPYLRSQLTELYKRGRGSYARLLFSATDVRDFGRTTRAVTAMATLDARRVAEHRRTLDQLRRERGVQQQTARAMAADQEKSRAARLAAERAVQARAALVADIDARRDLAARYAGELDVVYQRLQQQVASVAAGRAAETVALPLAPFAGTLEWPVAGAVTGSFGQTANRPGGAAARNGIDIAAPEDAPVRAVHGGTVGYADAFTGLGTLVILDHGADSFSLYGFLSVLHVGRGDVVDTGAELGRVGTGPGGLPGLYFEMRIDGRSVDPVQWLKPR